MTIEHVNIVDGQRHEPKGISTALAHRAYVSDGLGSGSWVQIGSADLKGLSGDGGVGYQEVVTDGLGGFKLVPHIHGSMSITANNVVFPLTAVGDATFNTPSQFTVFTGAGAPFTGYLNHGVTFSTDRLTVPVTGAYNIQSYSNIGAFPSATAKVATRYLINGTTWGTRKAITKSAVANDESQLVGIGITELNAGDYVQIGFASDASGNLLIKDSLHTLILMHAA